MPHKHSINFSGWRLAFGMVNGGSFCMPNDFWYSSVVVKCPLFLSQIYFKTGTFLLNLSSKSIKYSPVVLTYVEATYESD